MSNQTSDEKLEPNDSWKDQKLPWLRKSTREFQQEETDEFKWYIAKTATGQESKVAHSLKESIINLKLVNIFLESLSQRRL